MFVAVKLTLLEYKDTSLNHFKMSVKLVLIILNEPFVNQNFHDTFVKHELIISMKSLFVWIDEDNGLVFMFVALMESFTFFCVTQ